MARLQDHRGNILWIRFQRFRSKLVGGSVPCVGADLRNSGERGGIVRFELDCFLEELHRLLFIVGLKIESRKTYFELRSVRRVAQYIVNGVLEFVDSPEESV